MSAYNKKFKENVNDITVYHTGSNENISTEDKSNSNFMKENPLNVS